MSNVRTPENHPPRRPLPLLDFPSRMPPDHIGVLVAGAVMMVGGWYGLYVLVTTTLPRVGQRWLFFMLLMMAVTGTVIPFVRYLNVRFTPITAEPPAGGVIVRQSVWFGLVALTCAWLQIPRVLNLPIACLVALAFLVIEIFLRSREIRAERDEYG